MLPEFFIVEADTTKLSLRLEQMPEVLRIALKAKITQLTNQLLSAVHAREPVRTGRLRSLTRAYVDENRARNRISGKVRVLRTGRASTAGAAFGALEYGSTGQRFPVRGYRRNGHNVRAYQRIGTIRERRFLRGPAAILLPRARQELEQLIRETMQKQLTG